MGRLGERLRPAGQRRATALVAVAKRSLAAGDGTPAQSRAQLFLTMTAQDFLHGTGAAEAVAGKTGRAPKARTRNGRRPARSSGESEPAGRWI